MGSLLNDPALIQYKDGICANHRFQAVGQLQQRFVPEQDG